MIFNILAVVGFVVCFLLAYWAVVEVVGFVGEEKDAMRRIKSIEDLIKGRR